MISMNRSGSSLTEDQTDNLAVNECVRYILSREGSKIPIKQCDIRKHLEDNFNAPRNLMKNIISSANNVLKNVYGYKLVQVDAKQSQYIVVLNKPCTISMLSTYNNPQHRKLLIAALTHIYMSGTPIKEDDMWKFLTEAQLMKEFDVDKKKLLIKTFTRQMYLKYTKGRNDIFFFEWGQRAEEEIPKIFLLNKMSEAFNVAPDYWSEQYIKATRNENDDNGE
ncbi:non-structural maintenance of chromosomes element 3 homolog [Vanessa cardui]|uniref:non-structural maintenance of chromosomes element 3 homolog n=1 Tax=Vanessa cardui TaxID=171605 RepID=UPI001F131AAF|nr:non-structural maintenance of chromosomes element 3 homolog [Vanessa cardui]